MERETRSLHGVRPPSRRRGGVSPPEAPPMERETRSLHGVRPPSRRRGGVSPPEAPPMERETRSLHGVRPPSRRRGGVSPPEAPPMERETRSLRGVRPPWRRRGGVSPPEAPPVERETRSLRGVRPPSRRRGGVTHPRPRQWSARRAPVECDRPRVGGAASRTRGPCKQRETPPLSAAARSSTAPYRAPHPPPVGVTISIASPASSIGLRTAGQDPRCRPSLRRTMLRPSSPGSPPAMPGSRLRGGR